MGAVYLYVVSGGGQVNEQGFPLTLGTSSGNSGSSGDASPPGGADSGTGGSSPRTSSGASSTAGAEATPGEGAGARGSPGGCAAVSSGGLHQVVSPSTSVTLTR